MTGALVGVPGEGKYYHDSLNKAELGLASAAKVESYKGFVFATLDEQAPPLRDYLGWVGCVGLDMLAERGDIEEEAIDEAKPDFLDMDKDGDKKEPMKKAIKDKKKKQVKEGAEDMANDAKDAANDAVDKVKEAGDDAIEKAKDAGNDAVDKAKGSIGN